MDQVADFLSKPSLTPELWWLDQKSKLYLMPECEAHLSLIVFNYFGHCALPRCLCVLFFSEVMGKSELTGIIDWRQHVFYICFIKSSGSTTSWGGGGVEQRWILPELVIFHKPEQTWLKKPSPDSLYTGEFSASEEKKAIKALQTLDFLVYITSN